ncbi:MAG: 4Fe-4S binding protein, partial [Firmicutes bacterium]|nr:4Fe-4S binding protein [Bacillota bacterium]
VMIILFAIFVQRGFCQVLCPLGAIYSIFNPISFFTIKNSPSHCTHCGRCASACYRQLPELAGPNHPECIRCLKCVKNCPTGAMSWEIIIPGKKEGTLNA